MKLMIDTNVLLDVLTDREPFVEDSSMVWKLCETYEAEGMISSLSFANMMYVLRKHINKADIADMITDLSLIFSFEPLTYDILYVSSAFEWDDYEDAIQFATALSNEADYIVTRDKSGFRDSVIPVITPHELIEKYRDSILL